MRLSFPQKSIGYTPQTARISFELEALKFSTKYFTVEIEFFGILSQQKFTLLEGRAVI